MNPAAHAAGFYFCRMFSDYRQTLEYIYAALPDFQKVGASAYKADLHNTVALLKALGNPEKKFKSIHIGGTNGKGSSSHMLASVLQEAGYKTGLYTSPHLKDFTERIKINGQDVNQEFVIDFVNRIKPSVEKIKPSFFEITVAMAFEYFAVNEIDIAVVEVGLGGRLDSTNVIMPLVSLITNISFDHKDILGDTLEKIASEKAGIIKEGIPVVVSEMQPETYKVFIEKAKQTHSKIFFANKSISAKIDDDMLSVKGSELFQVNDFPLRGPYQKKNVPGVLKVIELLPFIIKRGDIINGLKNTIKNTGLKGRWQKIGESPLTVCDTGHNEAGIAEVLKAINKETFERLFIVFGAVKDKDINPVLSQLPKDAIYFFCEARIPRAMAAGDLAKQASSFGLKGPVIADVNDAIAAARSLAAKNDFIFVGGSTFVVAEITNL
ncbi:MAG TPA: folylpolyglutamate synthase/dihydrofolate synthase family protein [Cyclobacteriaceae bacterium]